MTLTKVAKKGGNKRNGDNEAGNNQPCKVRREAQLLKLHLQSHPKRWLLKQTVTYEGHQCHGKEIEMVSSRL